MFFIFYVGHFVCNCGKETGPSTGLINYSFACEQFDKVITSFVLLYISFYRIFSVLVQFN